ncbi:MAG: T9SS type A sorting domain-containing protein [Ignavibacteria bacterium]|jgi:hypothetical protein
MKILKSIPVLLIIFLGSVSAQNFVGKLNPYPYNQPNLPENDVLKILCVMVEFQEDKFDQTYGDGTFGSLYSEDYGNEIIDPLPHDKAYFTNHMIFAQNYYSKVSNGNFEIEFTVLPEIITVSQTMREYTALSTLADFQPLADFSQEVWQLADQTFTGTNFSEYDLFFIFHAGAGNDISDEDGVGDRSDLQSLYLSEKALKDIYGSDFEGFSVSNGSFYITNSAILPETENREIEVIGGVQLLELSINGLIVSTVASHIGLPDLFNTETGKSAIGKFGLMDGQAIFAYSGLFPPEPSAWEKIYLGWVEARELTPDGETYTIVSPIIASESAQSDVITIGKVNINSNEYYLIENKKRDANLDGVKITSIVDGQEVEYSFAKDDTSTITPSDVSNIAGVIIDVDEYDWAVSGFEIDQTYSDPFEDIGLQIWHIDETVINENLADNKINVDIDKLGVRLVEADGIPEIGYEFTTLTGTFIGEGTKEDTWYAGNPAEYYENEFNSGSKPSTTSNLGANSFISFSDFSDVGPQMSFKLSYEYGQVEKISTQNVQDISNVSQIKSVEYNDLHYHFILSDGHLQIIGDDNNFTLENETDFSIGNFAVSVIGNYVFAVGADNNMLNVIQFSGTDPLILHQLDVGENITSVPVVRNQSYGELQILVGTESGKVNEYLFDGTQNALSLNSTFEAFSGESVKQVLDDAEAFVAVSNDAVYRSTDMPVEIEQTLVKSVLTNDKDGAATVVSLGEENHFYITQNSQVIDDYDIDAESAINDFSLIDIFSNGENYIVVNDSIQINAFNLSGSQAENFPFKDPQGNKFTNTPLGADLNDDGKSEVIVFTEDGRIFAFDATAGEFINGFPVSTGSANLSTPVLFDFNNNVYISLINSNYDLTVWNIASNGSISWAEEFGDAGNNSFIDAASTENYISEFFPKNRAYNWPNPVYENETYIRYYVSEDSDVNIKIFDLAGDFVDELNHNGIGGIDNEVTWHVGDIQSGVYFARIEVNGKSGNSDNKIIKIAVIK